ncbi:MAG: formyltransferase family protein [Sheuella sp.]|nr:formyltransferase family protein [Sheuella sp.]
MKILFCSKNDIFGAVILNEILPQLKDHEVKVLLSDKTRAEENSVPDLVEEKFLERDFPLNLIFPLVDAQSLTGELLTFAGCAKKFNVDIHTILNINNPESEKMIRDWAPDIIISARFSLIFKSNIEQIPRLGIFNIHPGALPGYAGLCAPLRGMLNGEEKLGCTLHRVDDGIDTGPIYAVSYLDAHPEKSVFGHIAELYGLGLVNMMRLLGELSNGRTPALQVQDPAAFRYFRLPDAAAFTDLRARGVEPVSYEVYGELIRKFIPAAIYSGAQDFLNSKKIEHATTSIHSKGSAEVLAGNRLELETIF